MYRRHKLTEDTTLAQIKTALLSTPEGNEYWERRLGYETERLLFNMANYGVGDPELSDLERYADIRKRTWASSLSSIMQSDDWLRIPFARRAGLVHLYMVHKRPYKHIRMKIECKLVQYTFEWKTLDKAVLAAKYVGIRQNGSARLDFRDIMKGAVHEYKQLEPAIFVRRYTNAYPTVPRVRSKLLQFMNEWKAVIEQTCDDDAVRRAVQRELAPFQQKVTPEHESPVDSATVRMYTSMVTTGYHVACGEYTLRTMQRILALRDVKHLRDIASKIEHQLVAMRGRYAILDTKVNILLEKHQHEVIRLDIIRYKRSFLMMVLACMDDSHRKRNRDTEDVDEEDSGADSCWRTTLMTAFMSDPLASFDHHACDAFDKTIRSLISPSTKEELKQKYIKTDTVLNSIVVNIITRITGLTRTYRVSPIPCVASHPEALVSLGELRLLRETMHPSLAYIDSVSESDHAIAKMTAAMTDSIAFIGMHHNTPITLKTIATHVGSILTVLTIIESSKSHRVLRRNKTPH